MAELRTIVGAVASWHRAETGLCTGSNRFVPVCVFSQTPPHFSQEIFNMEGYRIQRRARHSRNHCRLRPVSTSAKERIARQIKKNSFLTNIRNRNEKSDSLVLVSF
jgi:hypothetical protein